MQALQILYGCSSSAAGAPSCVCESRLHVQLDAVRVAASEARPHAELQSQQPVEPVPLRPAEQQAEQVAGQAGTVGASTPGHFPPDSYQLPEECAKHEPLYAGIYDALRPWYERGVTRQDMDACLPVAPAGHDVALG